MKRTIKSVITQARLGSMKLQTVSSQLPRFNSRKPRIFNLDLHTALISDLRSGLSDFEVDLVSWSLSGNNRNVRKVFKVPDPVHTLKNKSWLEFTESDLAAVAEHYFDYFKTFDGFICTFPPAFLQIFEGFNKPILSYSGTRYEAPFTNNTDSWNHLNSQINSLVAANKLIFATNNQADSDYIDYHTGLKPELAPSLCDYTNMKWDPSEHKNIFFCRSGILANKITSETMGRWKSARDVLGKNYSYDDLCRAQSILVIPYNISTMSLFEFATAGIEVLIPSKLLLRSLFENYDGVLSELSFFQVQDLDVTSLSPDSPNNYKSDTFFDWWVSRSDFYNSTLMPNVKYIDSFEELKSHIPSDPTLLSMKMEIRNEDLGNRRHELLTQFIQML